MGTNFFWRTPACDHCGRSDGDLHVGKRSGGWSFLFRGYRHDADDEVRSPAGFAVESRVDWRRVFATVSGVLVDEYDDAIPDPLAWLDALQPPDPAQVAWEDGEYTRYRLNRLDVRDPERFRVSFTEFR